MIPGIFSCILQSNESRNICRLRQKDQEYFMNHKRRYRQLGITCFCFVVLVTGMKKKQTVKADDFELVFKPAYERGILRWNNAKSGKPAFMEDYTYRLVNDGGTDYLDYQRVHWGTKPGNPVPYTWITNGRFLATDHTEALYFHRRIFEDASATPVKEWIKTYYPGKVVIETIKKGKKHKVKKYKRPRNMYDTRMVPRIMANLPEGVRKVRVTIMSDSSGAIDATLVYRKTEKVKCPYGEFMCDKYEMLPELGIFNIFRGLIPNMYFWITTDSDRAMIRFKGFEKIGSPVLDMVQELLETDRDKQSKEQ